MTEYIRGKIPLIMVGGIFLILIAVVNMRAQPSQKIENGISHLIEGNYHIYGELAIQDKKQESALINQIALYYEGTINQKDKQMNLRLYMVFQGLGEEKPLGSLLRHGDTYYYQLPGKDKSYIKKTISSNMYSLSSLDEVINRLMKPMEAMTDEGIETITIGQHTIKQKITARKFSLIITTEDMVALLEENGFMQEQGNQSILKKLLGQPYQVEIICHMNGGYIYQLACIASNDDYTITLTNRFDDYEETPQIHIPEEAYEGRSVESLSEKELMDIINKLMMLN